RSPMADHEVRSLPIAVRVFPDLVDTDHSRKPWRCPEGMFVFNSRARVDATQKLTLGSYRFLLAGRCLEEGLFYGDDLPEADVRVLKDYAGRNPAETVMGGVQRLRVLTRREFLQVFYNLA